MASKALRLYVVGESASAIEALKNARLLLKKYLDDSWSLEVVDVLQCPDLADNDRISAVPALLRTNPRPIRRVVGDLSDHDQVLCRLEIDVVDIE